MRVQKKAFAYRVPIGDYNYLQCNVLFTIPWHDMILNLTDFVKLDKALERLLG